MVKVGDKEVSMQDESPERRKLPTSGILRKCTQRWAETFPMAYGAQGSARQLKWMLLLRSGPSECSGVTLAKAAETQLAPSHVLQLAFPKPTLPLLFLYLSLPPGANHFLPWSRVPELSRYVISSPKVPRSPSVSFCMLYHAVCGTQPSGDPLSIWSNE